MPISKETKERIVDKLDRLGVYSERSVNNTWCYKYSFPGQETIIVSHEDKDKAANNFFIEYLKSLHYSIRWLFEEKRFDELEKLIQKMQSYGEANINKTIEIRLRSGIAEALANYNTKQVNKIV